MNSLNYYANKTERKYVLLHPLNLWILKCIYLDIDFILNSNITIILFLIDWYLMLSQEILININLVLINQSHFLINVEDEIANSE